MEDAVNTTALVTGAIGVSIATELQGWIAIVCGIVSLISVIISIILRISNSIKNAKKEDSDGGVAITTKELDEITAQIIESTKQVQDRVTKLQSEVSKGNKAKDGKQAN